MGAGSAYVGMDHNTRLTFTPVDHPNPTVRHVGFELDSSYVEQCWASTLGPSSIALLRRMPVLWTAQVPAGIEAGELSASLGLGTGTGERSRLHNTLDRLVRFGLMRESAGGEFDVFCQVAPLSARQLERAPQWTVDIHQRLLTAHLTRVGATEPVAGGVDAGADPAVLLAGRLDRLQRPSPPRPVPVGARTGGLAR